MDYYSDIYRLKEFHEIEKTNTTLLHAKIGKDIAIKKFGFTESMGQAILNHTTGNKNMDIYSKILFIADRTSVDRNFEDLEYLKSLEDKGIDEAVLYILDKKIERLKKSGTYNNEKWNLVQFDTATMILKEWIKERYEFFNQYMEE